jgi:hypothetical protein
MVRDSISNNGRIKEERIGDEQAWKDSIKSKDDNSNNR